MASKKTTISIVIVIVIIAGVIAWLVGTGRLVVLVKNPKATAVVVPNVCSTSIVDEYNKAFDATNEVDFGKQLKKVVTTIQKQPGYKDDATCVAMLQYYAVYSGDAKSAQSYVDAVKKLESSGQYVNSNMRGFSGIDDMQTQVDSVKVNGGNPQNESTSGQGRG